MSTARHLESENRPGPRSENAHQGATQQQPTHRSGLRRKLVLTTGWIVGLSGALVALYIFVQSTRHSTVIVEGVAMTRLGQDMESLLADVEITIGGQRASNLVTYIVEIENRGPRDLTSDDIEYLRWLSPEGTTIVRSEVLGTSSGHGDFLRTSVRDNTLSFDVLSFNVGARARVGIICAEMSKAPSDPSGTAEGVIHGAIVVDETDQMHNVTRPTLLSRVLSVPLQAHALALLVYGGMAIVLLVILVIIGLSLAAVFDASRGGKDEEKTRGLKPDKKAREQAQLAREVTMRLLTTDSDSFDTEFWMSEKSQRFISHARFCAALDEEALSALDFLCARTMEEAPDERYSTSWRQGYLNAYRQLTEQQVGALAGVDVLYLPERVLFAEEMMAFQNVIETVRQVRGDAGSSSEPDGLSPAEEHSTS